MDDLINIFGEDVNASGGLGVAIGIVGFLIIIASIISLVVSIYLAVRYVKFNKKKNSIGMTGQDAARTILDMNGLQHIKVSATGSIMFGNSYSHYFKKVRLRRRTWKKDSVASLAMAAQKSSLAVLDKENDPDMKARIKLIPITTFGPLLFIPLIVVGLALDYVRIQKIGTLSIVCTVIGLSFYVFSFILALKTLKTEKKAQQRAVAILRQNNLATLDEIADMQTLFHLYNIEYVNDMIMSLLELIYNVLKLVALFQGKSSSSSSSND